MKTVTQKVNILSVTCQIFILITIYSCNGIKNNDRPFPAENEEGNFVSVRDGTNIFVYEYVPASEFRCTIYIISGITGINHKSEKDLIELLSNNVNRVVVIHPRGTGYSEGKRGDSSDLSDFIEDYVEIIEKDRFYVNSKQKTILFGHSMACAFAIKAGNELQKTDGLILVNPPYILKPAKGMTPEARDYFRYIAYYIFAPHIPVVKMSGDQSVIENETDRKESEIRNNDPLLVKYFSMHYMTESKKIMDTMVENARRADYPLLLLYGENDMIVDKSGCDEIFSAWSGKKKIYKIIKEGSHGKSTVIKGAEIIHKWVGTI